MESIVEECGINVVYTWNRRLLGGIVLDELVEREGKAVGLISNIFQYVVAASEPQVAFLAFNESLQFQYNLV